MERKGVITFLGNPLTLTGPAISVGQQAPHFVLLDNELNVKTLEDFAGKTLLISVVPSLDTGVCDMQTRKFNAEAAKLGKDVQILTVSCDLPFAQARWCGAAGATQLMTLSDHRDVSFGTAYGVAIKELRLLTRSIFVVDKKGIVTYAEIVPEVTDEVNFEAALSAVAKAV